MTVAGQLTRMLRGAELLWDSSAEQIVSMPVVRPRRWTRVEVDRLIDERPAHTPRYELVDGELLVTPAPRSAASADHLSACVVAPSRTSAKHKLGEIFLESAELPLVTGERYEPDLFVIPLRRWAARARQSGAVDGRFDLRTLSPGSSRHDRHHQAARAFQRNGGVRLLDRRRRCGVLEVWHPAGRAAGDRRRSDSSGYPPVRRCRSSWTFAASLRLSPTLAEMMRAIARTRSREGLRYR